MKERFLKLHAAGAKSARNGARHKLTSMLAAALLAAGLAASIPSASAADSADDGRKYGSVTASEKAVSARAFMDDAGAPATGVSSAGDFERLAPKEAAPSEFDPEATPRVHAISQQLRCLVCANETIAESNAQLAVDLRREVAAQVKAGRTDDEVIAFMVERYGDYVLFKPPFKAKTWLLWLGPAALVLLALWGLVRLLATRRACAASRSERATPEAIERAKKLLSGELVFEAGEICENPAFARSRAGGADGAGKVDGGKEA